ncbi:MAG TPA: aminopeptidase N, partial [Devosia sp.]|nr:aminopeptidase N [Devosia sp.]
MTHQRPIREHPMESNDTRNAAPAAARLTFLKDYRPPAYDISHVDMTIRFAPDGCQVISQLSIAPAPGTAAGTPLELDGEELELVDISIDGEKLAADSYGFSGNNLLLSSPPDHPFTLKTEVNVYPEENTRLMGLYRSNSIWCTQCEAEGFRRITFMLDRPDVMATYRVRMEALKGIAPVLLSNGNLQQNGTLADNTRFAVWEDPFPKPTYLFACVAGHLDRIEDDFVTRSDRNVNLAIYCEPGKGEKCRYAMDSLKRAMKWDEERFGREYDLDVFNIVAVSDFNIGAMENKGLNIFNDRYILADPDNATDADYAQIERIVAHEYFHNWTGNRVTCRDWFQLCLKEGLTVYRDQEFTSDMRSRPVKRIGDVLTLRSRQFPEDAGPLAHPPRPDRYAEIDNFYTPTVYEKGAEIVRMLANLLGAETFRKGCDLYFERHDGQAVTIEDWIRVFEEVSGRDLEQFAKWYTQAGTPLLDARQTWDQHHQSLTLSLSQKTPPTPGQTHKEPMLIPIRFGLIGADGADIDLASVIVQAEGATLNGAVIEMDAATASIRFSGLPEEPVVSLLRTFSAPVVLNQHRDAATLAFVARHDRDPFNRWQAGQAIATRLMAEATKADTAPDTDGVHHLADILEKLLAEEGLDNAFKALMLLQPDEASIARHLGGDIHPDRIHGARQALLHLLGERLLPVLEKTILQMKDGPETGLAGTDLEAAGKRALANQCLRLGVAARNAEMDAMAIVRFTQSTNMTNRIAALSAMVAAWRPGASELLAGFRNDYCEDPL